MQLVPHLFRLSAALSIALAVAPGEAGAQYLTPKVITLNEEGRPQYSIYSVCAVDAVIGANHEPGMVTLRPGPNAIRPRLVIGERVLILSNNACATAAQHSAYHVVQGASPEMRAEWTRLGGW